MPKKLKLGTSVTWTSDSSGWGDPNPSNSVTLTSDTWDSGGWGNIPEGNCAGGWGNTAQNWDSGEWGWTDPAPSNTTDNYPTLPPTKSNKKQPHRPQNVLNVTAPPDFASLLATPAKSSNVPTKPIKYVSKDKQRTAQPSYQQGSRVNETSIRSESSPPLKFEDIFKPPTQSRDLSREQFKPPTSADYTTKKPPPPSFEATFRSASTTQSRDMNSRDTAQSRDTTQSRDMNSNEPIKRSDKPVSIPPDAKRSRRPLSSNTLSSNTLSSNTLNSAGSVPPPLRPLAPPVDEVKHRNNTHCNHGNNTHCNHGNNEVMSTAGADEPSSDSKPEHQYSVQPVDDIYTQLQKQLAKLSSKGKHLVYIVQNGNITVETV